MRNTTQQLRQLTTKERRRGDRNESLTVLRACEVLKTFRYVGEELSLSTVIERAHMPKTTTFRLLKTLIQNDGINNPLWHPR